MNVNKKTPFGALILSIQNRSCLFCLMHTLNTFGAGFDALAIFLRPLQIYVLFSFSSDIGMAAANT